MQVLINGKILYRKITGVERYAHETLREIDNRIRPYEFKIAIPNYYDEKVLLGFKNLDVVKIKGFRKGFLWDQISLPLYAAKNGYVIASLDFTTPIFRPGISTIHDMSFKVNRNFFSKSLKQQFVKLKLDLYCYSATRSRYPIFTVSQFQKNEIVQYYGISPNKVIVAGNAWQHFLRIKEDNSVFDDFGIKKGEYYFSLSSNTANKNFKWVYEAVKANPEEYFVIVGGKTSITFENLKSKRNIKYLGFQSDERVKSLYRYCKAFIFPSLYEGFGIPPMEAMAVGAKAIVSNASSLPEIYGESVYYIDPLDANVNLNKLLHRNTISDRDAVLGKYSWEKTADIWISALRKYQEIK